MTIKELYDWAKEKGFENYPILINNKSTIKHIKSAEIVNKDDIFDGVFYNVITTSIILK